MNIIEIAKEAGFDIDEGLFPFEASEDKFIGTERTLEAFADLVRAEREWVDFTDDEIEDTIHEWWQDDLTCKYSDLARKVIAAFKEKQK